MTDQELDELTEDLKNFLAAQKGKRPRKRGLFSKIIVILCILLVVAYTGFCLVMQWKTGTQPEPQLTIVFFGFVTVELWNLAKIKRSKDGEKK